MALIRRQSATVEELSERLQSYVVSFEHDLLNQQWSSKLALKTSGNLRSSLMHVNACSLHCEGEEEGRGATKEIVLQRVAKEKELIRSVMRSQDESVGFASTAHYALVTTCVLLLICISRLLIVWGTFFDRKEQLCI